jgi:hypothetical protein
MAASPGARSELKRGGLAGAWVLAPRAECAVDWLNEMRKTQTEVMMARLFVRRLSDGHRYRPERLKGPSALPSSGPASHLA